MNVVIVVFAGLDPKISKSNVHFTKAPGTRITTPKLLAMFPWSGGHAKCSLTAMS